MAIILNDNIDTRAPKPTDNRFGPFTTTTEALVNIPEYQRYVGLTVGVGTPIVEYWFDSTLTLVLKTTSGTVTGITAGIGINIGGTAEAPIISVTSPTQLTTNISTDVITDGASDIKYPSVKATKTYVDANVAGLLDDRGNFPATSGDYPIAGGSGPAGAIRKGDLWFISVPGNLNGIAVGIGASVRALIDDAQPTTNADWDILDTGLGFIPENVANKVIRGTSIAAAPTSETLYASLSALTEYLSSIPPTTPTLGQVLAATPSQTVAGYDINLESLDGNLTTNVGRGEFNVTNVSEGTSVTAVDDTLTIASINNEIFITSDIIEFTNDVVGTLTLQAVPNNNVITLPNQTATLIASVNNSIFADAFTGDITIPLIGSTGTENFIPKWSSSSSLGDSIIQQVGTNNIQIGSSSLAGLRLDLFSSDRVDFRMYPYSTTTEYFGIYSYGPTGYGSSYTQIGLNDGITSNQQGAALYLDTRASLPPLSLMVKDDTTNAMTYALSVATNGNVGIGTTSPEYKLDLVSTDSPNASYARFANDGSNKNAILLGSSTSSYIFLTGPSAERKLLIGNGSTGLADFITYSDNYFNFTYSSALGGAQNPASLIRFTPNFVYSIGTNSHTILDLFPNILITGGTNTLRGVYYNPNNTAGTVTTEIAWENTQGDIIHGNLSGVGNRMVIADDDGKLGTAPIPTGGGGTVTSIATTSPLTGGTITVNGTIGIQQASTSQDGYLSQSNWNTFNNKFDLPSLTTGSVLFSNGTTIAQDNANFFWDNANDRLGIGTATPGYKLDVNGEINTNNGIRISTNGAQTGFYGEDNIIKCITNGIILSTWRFAGIGFTYCDNSPSSIFNTFDSGTFTNVFKISGNLRSDSINNANLTQLNISPQYAQQTFGTGTLRGIYYNPSLGSGGINASKHTAFENVTGNVLLGTTSGNVGIKNNNPQYTLDLEGSANFKLADNTPAVPYANKLSVRNGVLRLGFTLDAGNTFRYIQFTDETDLVENFMFGATKGLYNPALGISDPANTAINNPVIAMAQKDALYIMSGAASPDVLGDKTALVIKKDGRVKYRPLSTAPTTNLEEGDTYYDSGLQKLRVYTATGWQNLN
jgi:hypothetical protein